MYFMKIFLKKKETEDIFIWNQWFAWFPVRVRDNIVFLENVERKLVDLSEREADLAWE